MFCKRRWKIKTENFPLISDMVVVMVRNFTDKAKHTHTHTQAIGSR